MELLIKKSFKSVPIVFDKFIREVHTDEVIITK